jgi:predicted transcriptional regulator of viral defense system
VAKMDKILELFKKSGRSAFSTREYSALLGKGAYARLSLSRHRRRGEISRIKNGWWAFSGATPEAAACEASKPCYVSFMSALALHGLTTQIPRMVQLAVARTPRKYEIFGVPAVEYRVKGLSGFGRRDGILLATPEQALADCLEHPRACPAIVVSEAAGKINAWEIRARLSPAAKRRLASAQRSQKWAGVSND